MNAINLFLNMHETQKTGENSTLQLLFNYCDLPNIESTFDISDEGVRFEDVRLKPYKRRRSESISR